MCHDFWETRICLTHCASTKPDAAIIHQSEGAFSLDNRIAHALLEESSLSLRQIVNNVIMSKSALYRHLAESMRWKLQHPIEASHTLTES
jgi:hypothetical protein